MNLTEGSTFTGATTQDTRRESYEFGPYRLDVSSQRLLRAGEPVAATPKTLDLLLLLIRHRDRVVLKGELMRELWPDTIVEEANLTQQVFSLRKILDEGRDGNPSCIETVPRRGYRFVSPVRDVSDGQAVQRRRHSRRAVVALAIAVAVGVVAMVMLWPASPATDPVMLAVLPFENLSGLSASDAADEQLPFADSLAVGIPDAIITRLSGLQRFRVRPTSVVARYQQQNVDAQQVGRILASHYVLAGTVRATADRVRVSVQLIRTADGSTVWGQQYDRGRAELLGVEDAIAAEISKTLRVQMSEAERERFYRRYTSNGEAYERYLMGRARLRMVTEQGAMQAIAEFEVARTLDPNYALAYAGLSTAAAQLRVRFNSDKGAELWDVRARREAGHALQLDPDLAEAHVALAAVHRFQEYDWDTVIRESRRALELNPSLDAPHLYLAVAYFHLGLMDAAESEVEVAQELNPDNRVERLEILGAIRLFSGRLADAADVLSQAQHLSDSRILGYLRGLTLFYQGNRADARSLLETMIDAEGPLPGNARAALASIHAADGAEGQARALAERVARERDLIHHGAYNIGTTYAQLRDAPTAIRWLVRASTTGFPCYPWFERDPLLDPIRGDAAFVAVMRDLRRSWEDARAKYIGGVS
jgi:DNA-binding winged helix-turn-helix (wHTH) protein/TolB-like protein